MIASISLPFSMPQVELWVFHCGCVRILVFNCPSIWWLNQLKVPCSVLQARPEAKRLKKVKSSEDDEAQTDSGNASKAVHENPKPPEPPKQDYIHVRARRGQATDSHSLAERVSCSCLFTLEICVFSAKLIYQFRMLKCSSVSGTQCLFIDNRHGERR
jgi:hypothetical protein